MSDRGRAAWRVGVIAALALVAGLIAWTRAAWLGGGTGAARPGDLGEPLRPPAPASAVANLPRVPPAAPPVAAVPSPPPPAPDRPPEGAAAYRGRVLDAETGAPIGGAIVAADARPTGRTATTADGTFEVAGPPLGLPGVLMVRAPGYASAEVVPDTGRETVVRLVRGAVIEGVVRTSGRHAPIPDARVTVRGWDAGTASLDGGRPIPADEALAPGAFVNWQAALTDAEGRFRITGVSGSLFHVQVEKLGFVAKSIYGDSPWLNHVRAGDCPLDVRLMPAWGVAFDARDAVTRESMYDVGWSIAGADMLEVPPDELVARWPEGPQYWLYTNSREEPDLMPPAYRVTLHLTRLGYKPVQVELVPQPIDPERAPVPLTVDLVPIASELGEIEVLVERPAHAAGVPVAVHVRPAGVGQPGFGGLWLTITGASDRMPLPAGDYVVYGSAEANGDEAPSTQTDHEVRVVAGATASVRLPMTGGTLDLRVDGPGGAPLSGVIIFLARDGQTSGGGLDLVANISPGTYRMQLTPGQHELVLDQPGYARVSVPVEVKDGAAVSVIASLTPEAE